MPSPRPSPDRISLKQADAKGVAAAEAMSRAATVEHPLTEQVQALLEMIRPAVVADGGDVELVDITTDGVVRVRFHGACVGCPSSSITLQTGIERNLRQRIPEITGVIAVS